MTPKPRKESLRGGVAEYWRGAMLGMKGSYVGIKFIQVYFSLAVGWFTITPMLQDLDSLSARLGQLVQWVGQLQEERASLLSRVRGLEQERDAVRDQLARAQAEHQTISQQAHEHTAAVETVRQQAEAAQAELRFEVSRYQADIQAAQQDLLASRSEADKLRAAALAAQQRIDAVLVRLPGAPQE